MSPSHHSSETDANPSFHLLSCSLSSLSTPPFLTLIISPKFQISVVSLFWFSPLFSIDSSTSNTSKIYFFYSSPSSQCKSYLEVRFLFIDFDLFGVKSSQSCVPHIRYFL
ncbi:hypothetical protein Hanom_Chr01g00083181 [Helianthus anomalus]